MKAGQRRYKKWCSGALAREKIAFTYEGDGKPTVVEHVFEGVIPNMARRLRETDSQIIRDDLARLRSTRCCPDCQGTRLRREARFVRVGEGAQSRAIYQVNASTLAQAHQWFTTLKLQGNKADIAEKVVHEIAARLRFLLDVGLNYLSLDRSADTLSGGESQRIRLASQIGSGLTGVMYVLDEPSIGLHQRDNDRLIATLQHLRNIGNSVIVVEHDEDMMRAADCLIDMGPGAGVHGGQVMAHGHVRGGQSQPTIAHGPVSEWRQMHCGAHQAHALAARESGGCQCPARRRLSVGARHCSRNPAPRPAKPACGGGQRPQPADR